MGQLVGLFAHDLSNLLSATLSRVELASRVDDPAKMRQLLDGALESMQKQRRLIESMARASSACARPARIDVDAFVGARRDAIAALIAPATLDLRLGAAQATLSCDAGFLDAALLHIAIHARKAMSATGVLQVSTETLAASEATPTRSSSVILSARYEGRVMDDEQRKLAFTAFGLGPAATDLGLAQVQDTARRAGGHARIESAADGPTLIRLSLPASTR